MKRTLLLFCLIPVILLILALGYFLPLKSVTVQGCPGANHTQRHNLILGDRLPNPSNDPYTMQECVPTVQHVLYLF